MAGNCRVFEETLGIVENGRGWRGMVESVRGW